MTAQQQVIGLPTAVDHERFVLGSVMLYEDALHDLRLVIDADDFSLEENRRLWASVCRLYDAGRPVDYVSVASELSDRKELASDGLHKISTLTDGIPHNPHLTEYVNRLKEKAALRKIIWAADSIMKRAASGAERSQDLIDALATMGSTITPKASGHGLQSTGELVSEVGISTLLQPRKAKGLMFPWPWMNARTYGMMPSELWVLAGHTSTGKTSAAIQHAVGLARRGIGVAIFSLEVGKISLFQKCVYQIARIDTERLKSGEPLSQEERDALRYAANEVSDLPLYFDTTATTSTAIHAMMRQRSAKNKIGHMIVDYLQLLGNTGRVDNRAQAVGANTWAMKMIATDFQIPVLLLSQFSRESNKPGKARRPELSDLKESGDIENHANGVWFIHRPGLEDADQVPVEFILPKQRDGRRNIYTDMWFMSKYQRFEEQER